MGLGLKYIDNLLMTLLPERFGVFVLLSRQKMLIMDDLNWYFNYESWLESSQDSIR